MKQLVKFVTLSLLVLTLQGCVFVVGAAAGAAAIAVVYDHRTLEENLHDTKITNRIIQKIKANLPSQNDSHIEVTTFNKVVLLTGETTNPDWRQIAEDQARSVHGVVRVYNEITIQGPSSTLTHTSDSWITAKIRAEMLASEELRSASLKVVTENGVVYLLGTVTQQQSQIAVDIARQISGVQKVVKIFQYRN
jgi:osmotically-inducible protein OsmY